MLLRTYLEKLLVEENSRIGSDIQRKVRNRRAANNASVVTHLKKLFLTKQTNFTHH